MIDPKDRDSLYNRAIAYRAKRDCDHAIADFTAALALGQCLIMR